MTAIQQFPMIDSSFLPGRINNSLEYHLRVFGKNKLMDFEFFESLVALFERYSTESKLFGFDVYHTSSDGSSKNPAFTFSKDVIMGRYTIQISDGREKSFNGANSEPYEFLKNLIGDISRYWLGQRSMDAMLEYRKAEQNKIEYWFTQLKSAGESESQNIWRAVRGFMQGTEPNYIAMARNEADATKFANELQETFIDQVPDEQFVNFLRIAYAIQTMPLNPSYKFWETEYYAIARIRIEDKINSIL